MNEGGVTDDRKRKGGRNRQASIKKETGFKRGGDLNKRTKKGKVKEKKRGTDVG